MVARYSVFKEQIELPARLRPLGYGGQLDAKTELFELGFRIELVENTGIEPVTSCVQGRRSPS